MSGSLLCSSSSSNVNSGLHMHMHMMTRITYTIIGKCLIPKHVKASTLLTLHHCHLPASTDTVQSLRLQDARFVQAAPGQTLEHLDRWAVHSQGPCSPAQNEDI